MSKKKIIAGIMGTVTLITGDGAISTVATTISEKEEKNEEKKSKSWKQKKIRNKREYRRNNELIQNNFVEKIYDQNSEDWTLSLVLSKNDWEQIVNVFIQNSKNNFILETKKIIANIKNNSINLSSQNFDEGNIDAFAHHIWNNFSEYYNLMWNMGISQLGNFYLYIDNNGNYIKPNNFVKFIGKKSILEISQEILKNINNNNEKKCEIKNNPFLFGNSVEKSTSSKIKIKINKLTWSKIFILFYLVKNNDIFIEKLIHLFKTFPPSYNDYNYQLNEEEMKSFAYLIWKNFSYYYDFFKKLENSETVRITSYTNYPQGYWTSKNFYDYNEIVDKNNDVINWQTFNYRREKIMKKENNWTSQHNDKVNRKKRSEGNWLVPDFKNFFPINLSDIIFNTNFNSENLSNLTPEIIMQNLSLNNPVLDVQQISVYINKKEGIIEITAKPNSKYKGSIIINVSNEDAQPATKKPKTIHSQDLPLQNNHYDVIGDGNCLFWAVATAYLLPVRNNNLQFEERFIQLFGLVKKNIAREFKKCYKIMI